MAVKVHYKPADDDRAARESTHGNKIDSSILSGKGVVDRNQNGEACNCQCKTKCNVWKAETRAIRQVGDNQGQRQGGSDRWYGMQLGLHGRVTKRFDDCWSKIGETCELNALESE